MQIFKIPKLVHGIYNRFIWDVKTDQKNIFLTFDDGPSPECTKFIIDILDEYNAKATFFCVGDNVVKHPELYNMILEKGHSVGNHTHNHLKNTRNTTQEYIKNVAICASHVKSNLFRPPYGRISREQASELINNGYEIIMYTVLTNDFNQELYPDYILKRSIKQTSLGSIIVFHDSLKASTNVKAVLPKYLEHFTDKGYSFKKIDTTP